MVVQPVSATIVCYKLITRNTQNDLVTYIKEIFKLSGCSRDEEKMPFG